VEKCQGGGDADANANAPAKLAKASNVGLSDTFEYLSNGPFCLVALDSSSGRAIQTNETFEQHMGPIFKYAGFEFSAAATEGENHRTKLEKAIESVKNKTVARVNVNNVEMLTLAGDAGVPIRKHFDWTVGQGKDDHILLLFGYPCTGQDIEQRSKDAELIDFFQNAPIALHWLSGEGIVLWANQTELDVLGYTAEEYIGQPIMNFCPDEQELVLEIFKQLGSGNAIKDVPVRFRTKDGRIVDLLIDSNVKYDTEGNFAHTRCFIRDDTTRKIREARSILLLAETKRSLKMLDNFMSRSIHHMRTPLHMMQNTCELIAEQLRNPIATDVRETLEILDETAENITNAVNMADDIIILARLDQGAELEVKKENVDIRELGKEALGSVRVAFSNAQLSFEQNEGCPSMISTDKKTLTRILRQLLANAVTAISEGGIVKLSIGYENGHCTFTVIDSGHGFEMKETYSGSSDSLPPIFQRYHHELLPEDIVDFEEASSLRSRIEESVSSHRKNSIGIGLSLSYFLVQALGGELRCSSAIGQSTKFWFSLPVPEPLPGAIQEPTPDYDSKEEISPSGTGYCHVKEVTPEKMTVKELPQEILLPQVPKANIAQFGLTAMDRPSVLVVEDTALCAKLLCKALGTFQCSSSWAANGQEAVDMLRSSTPNLYDLILMDLRMPVLDGLGATEIIKNELKLTTPVVALTAETNNDIRAECSEVGFDDFCTKPLKRDQLKQVIQKHTGYSPA
jgi:PAS domain S-box-containing protein